MVTEDRHDGVEVKRATWKTILAQKSEPMSLSPQPSRRAYSHALSRHDEAYAQLVLGLELVQLARDAVVDRLGRAGQVVLDVRDDDRDALEPSPRCVRGCQIGEHAQLLEDVGRAEMAEQRLDRSVAGVRASAGSARSSPMTDTLDEDGRESTRRDKRCRRFPDSSIPRLRRDRVRLDVAEEEHLAARRLIHYEQRRRVVGVVVGTAAVRDGHRTRY